MLPHSKIVIATLGSLGDLHPFIAIARELQRRGHVPVVATLPCYRRHVVESGTAFHPVRPYLAMDDATLMRSIAGSPRGLDSLVSDHLVPHLHQSFEDLAACTRGAAAVIVGCLSYAAPRAAEACGVPWCSAVLSPLYLSAKREVVRVASSPRCALALFSNLLSGPRPKWAAGTTVTGFAFYDGPQTTDTSPALERFLTAGEAPLVFTLGSAAVFDPGSFFEESVAAAQQLRRRAVIVTGANIPPRGLPDDVLAIPYVPFSTLFPRAAAIIHQGGIGTVGQALRSGQPMLIVPRFLDQPDNAIRVRRLGVGRIMHASAYTARAAAAEIQHLLDSPTYASRAREVGARVRLENGTVAACDAFERALDLTTGRAAATYSAARFA